MYLTIQGLVLRVTDYNDNDSLLTVLSRDHGKLTVKARGLRRKKSPLVGPCQLLAFSEFTLFEYKSMYTIQEANCIELFQGLRKNLDLLSLGTYFAQVSDVVSQEDWPSPELLSLTLNCFHGLTKLDLPPIQVKAVFELRVACIAGYMPELSGCYRCGCMYPDRFDIRLGRLECGNCRDTESGGIRFPVTPGILDAMRYICNCENRRLFSFQSGAQTMEQLAQITESYLLTQLERGFTTLDFYKSLLL